jgi:hypothetical protein
LEADGHLRWTSGLTVAGPESDAQDNGVGVAHECGTGGRRWPDRTGAHGARVMGRVIGAGRRCEVRRGGDGDGDGNGAIE